MSSTDNQTKYDYTLNVVQNATGAQSNCAFTLWAESGIDDATALAVAAALRSVAMPAGTVAQVAVQKTDVNQVSYSTNLAADVPAFT